MMARRGFGRAVLALLVGSAAAALSGCGSTDTLRYKMIVEVETPSSVKTGFAVREVAVRTPASMPMLGEDRGSTSVRGEAVAVDLPGGKTLFALLTGASGDVDYGARVADREGIWGGAQAGKLVQIWPRPPYPGSPKDHENYKRGHAMQYPMLVTFGDMADPKSVARVDPDNLAATFGPGVRLRRIMVAVTDEPVTTGIEKRLGWLLDLHGSYIDRSPIGNANNQGMSGMYFTTETFK
jgi:hypothetical protein